VVEAVVITIAVAACVLLWARTVRPRPRVDVAASTCRKCRYSLKGLPRWAVCPECGVEEPSYRELKRSRDEVIFEHWSVSVKVIGAAALMTLWPIVLHEIAHATAGWLNASGFGPNFSPGPMPGADVWVGLPLTLFMIAGISVGEVAARARLRAGLAMCGALWFVLSGLTVWSWFDPNRLSNYAGLSGAGLLSGVIAVAVGVVIVPVTFWELSVWLIGGGSSGKELPADREEWLEKSQERTE
jgi:hypothetical protein